MYQLKLPKRGKVRCYHGGVRVPRTGEIREDGDFLGFHCGSLSQALTRLDKREGPHGGSPVKALKRIEQSEVGLYEIAYKKPHRLIDETELYVLTHAPRKAEEVRNQGYDLIPYMNACEADGCSADAVAYVGMYPWNIKLIKVSKVVDMPEAQKYPWGLNW